MRLAHSALSMNSFSQKLFVFFLVLLGIHPAVYSQKVLGTKPEKVGLSSARLERINTLMQDYVDEGKLAGVVTMVARRGKVAHFERFGLMDIETRKPMQLDTIFRIYSMSKPITSVAVMMLYEEGRFLLNDPVSKYTPEFKDLKVFIKKTEEGLELTDLEREITIRDLLSHTAGLGYGWNDDPAFVELYEEADLFNRKGTIKDMVEKLTKLPLLHQPGTKWHYSVSVDVLGYFVEVISGIPFDQFLEGRIFKPLGMKDTAFYVPEESWDRFPTSYEPDENGGIKVNDAVSPSRYLRPPSLFSGGGGLVSTAEDYMRFSQMLLNGGELDGTRLLGRKTVELMTINHVPEEIRPGIGFGLGFLVVLDVAKTEELGSVGKFGWAGYAYTRFFIDPKEELIGVFMTQLAKNDEYTTHEEFRVSVYQSIVD